MRLFGSDRIARWMDKSGAEEGEVITGGLVTRAIEQAQKRVELQNFQQRKRLLEYDDVMNQQREVIYSLRLFALERGEELKAEARRMIEAALERAVDPVPGRRRAARGVRPRRAARGAHAAVPGHGGRAHRRRGDARASTRWWSGQGGGRGDLPAEDRVPVGVRRARSGSPKWTRRCSRR